MFKLMLVYSAHRPQHGQRHQDRGGHRLRTPSRRATGLRLVRTQAATGRAGLSRPGVGHRARVAAGRVGCAVAGAGDRVHRARDHDVRRGRLSGRRRADVRPGTHRSGRRHPGRRTHHPAGAHSHAGGPAFAEPVERRGDRRLRGLAAARLSRRRLRLRERARLSIASPIRDRGAGYQVFQCVRLSAGSRLAGRKSVPLV